MNAQEEWKRHYRLLKATSYRPSRKGYRVSMILYYRREAALERKLEAAQRITSRDIEALSGIVSGWRDYANGHYCMTYNVGMSQGLKLSADALEAYVNGMKQRNTVKDLMR